MIYDMAILGKADSSPLRNVSQQKPRSLNGPLKKFPQTFGRDPQCQKLSKLIYFHNQTLKLLPRNLGHESWHIDPGI